MEFGDLLFDNDGDENEQTDIKEVTDYVPKNCEQEWFSNVELDRDAGVFKYRADLNYYKGNYRSALDLYKRFLHTTTTTHSQLRREVIDCIVRCCIRCGVCEEGIEWCRELVASPYERDHTSWQLMANCHRLTNNYRDEALCRIKCTLLARHFPQYWAELSHAYSQLLVIDHTTICSVDSDLLNHTLNLFRPYFNNRKALTSSSFSTQYELFVKLLCTPPPRAPVTIEEYTTILRVAFVASTVRTDQLVSYCKTQSNAATAMNAIVKTSYEVTDTVFIDSSDYQLLQGMIIQYMQSPHEIEI